jgi:rubrerythrin
MANVNEDLTTAFSGESQANRKYLAFAKKAEEEGLNEVARLFRVAAESETVHALKHLNVMGGVKNTAENLKMAFDGETLEFTEMYPGMIANAEAEGNNAAKASFSYANEVEKEHADLYHKAIENPSEFKLGNAWVCQGCGHVHIGDTAPDVCPVCGAPKEMFQEVD